MSNYPEQRFPAKPAVAQGIRKPRRLKVNVPPESFQAAFVTFSGAAEKFAMSLSDELNRKFAYRHLEYLQSVARGQEPIRFNVGGGRPAYRLIRSEMERLFRDHFFRSGELPAERRIA